MIGPDFRPDFSRFGNDLNFVKWMLPESGSCRLFLFEAGMKRYTVQQDKQCKQVFLHLTGIDRFGFEHG